MFNKATLLFEKAYLPAFNLAMAVAAARFLGVEAVGNLALIFAFSSLGQYLTSRGTDQNIHVAYASCPNTQLAPAVVAEIRIRLIRLSISILCLTSLYALLSSYLNDPMALFFGLLGVTLGATSACAMPNEIRLIVTQNFRSLVILKYTSGCIAVLIGFLLIYYLNSKMTVFIGILILEKIVYLALTITTSRIHRDSTQATSEARAIPKINIHVLISAVAIFGYNRMDQIYIYGAFSSQNLGVYFSTIKLFEVVNLLIMAAITAQLRLMADRRQNPLVTTNIERKLLALSFALITAITLAAPLILNLFFGIQSESNTYIYILASGTLFGTIGAIKGPWVAKNNRFNINTYFTITGGIIAIGILTFYKPASLAGVAVIMALGQFVVNILCPLMLKAERDHLISLISWSKR